MSDKPKYAFFWGCQIPARLPFMEKSTRIVLSRLGVECKDLPGFTCCPERNLVKNMDEWTWFLTAARNLAVAERAGLPIVTACNGCYGTLKSVATELKSDPGRLNRVNEALGRVGLSLRGRVEVKHIIEVLHAEVGPDRIRKAVVKPLHGMVIAVHPGCHLLRPSHSLQFDNPLQPTKYDELVVALGAKSLAYTTKMNCCGGALGHVGEVEESTALAQRKLLEVEQKGADALTTCCPECFLQYDTKQALLKRRGDKIHVPVLTYPELLGLALGLSPEELGLSAHRVSADSFLGAWEERSRIVGLAAQEVDLAAAERCRQCGACASDCPVALNQPTFDPGSLVGEFCAGRIEELLEKGEFWRCLECHTCLEMCPQNFGMERVFTALKHLAISRRVLPSGVNIGLGMFVKSGRLGEPDDRARRKLGLGELPQGGAEDLRRLLSGGGTAEPTEDRAEEVDA